MNIISKIKGCLTLAVVAAGFAAWAATVPTDAQGFDTTAENDAPFYSTTFVPGDYCIVDLTTGKVTEEKNVESAATFNTDDYKTTKMAFRYVPAGKFKAVCGKANNSYKDLVTNDVSLSAYWMAVFPVTEAQYNAVMGGETTSVKPKASISWNDFRGGDWAGWDGTYANVPAPGDGTFVKALNDKVAAAGCKDKFDLCTSFQWERAARAGTRTDYFFSNETAASVDTGEFELLKNYAWYKGNNTPSGTKDVGEKLPNAWGLYDVYGNIYENCLDWSKPLDGVTPGIDYAGPATGGYRVYRSGCYIATAARNSSVYWTQKNPADGADSNGFRLIRKPATSSDPSVVPAISAKSEKFTVDLRGEIALAKGAVTIAGVSYSDTAWGAADAEDVKLDYTNETTGATGVLKPGLSGEDVTEVDLPKKNGGYKLTHSTGDLTSFVKFTVTGYPLGSEGNPWEIGANAAAEVIAFSNGTGTVTFKPVRGTVTKAGLETITNAMGGASFPAKLIAADGSETNDLVMVLGASGTAYESIADALAANEASYTLFETDGYFVSYDGNGAAGTMATDTFIPTISTNLTANAYTAVGYEFAGWTTNGSDKVAYADRAAGVDFAQPGETLALKAKWTDTGVAVATFDALTNALVAATNQAATLPVTVNLTDDITVPQGGVVKVYASPAVTFTGTGKFDVSAEHPALFGGYPVGTGLKPEDLGRFVTDKDVKAYYEDGKVVVRGRGETEEFPWLLGTAGHEDEVTAWAGDGMIFAKPTRGTASVAALQSVTNALSGYVPGLGELKVISADGTATNNVVMLLGSDGVPYDTLAEVLAADPMPETVRLFEVKGYFVSYDGGWGSNGKMETDTFIPTVPTNLTANAYMIVGYDFDGWSKDGTTVAYTNRQEGVDFAKPGETLVLTALWTHVGVEPTDYRDLADKLPQVTRPVTFDLVRDIEIPVGGMIVVPSGKDVTFAGIGKFDVTATIPTLWNEVVVGEGFADDSALALFKTHKDAKAYFEDGKVVLHARGESADFPWVLGEGVEAWVIDGAVLAKPVRGTASVAALASVTNALSGYVPGLGELKVISADGTATNDVVMLLGSDGVVYDTLEEVFAADPMPETVRLFEVKGYFVSYDGNGAAGTMATDTFIPTVPTNLTANAYTIVGYEFAGWTTNGSDEVAYADQAAGVDFAQPGETLALKAKWTANDYAISYAMDDGTPFGAWAAGYTAPTVFSVTNNATLPVKANVDEANFLFNAWTNAEGVVFTTTDGLLADLAVYADVTRLWSVKLPTVAHATCVASTNGVPLAAGRKVVDGATVTFALTPDAGYVLEGPSVYTATARADDVTVATDDTKIKKIVAVEIRPTEHATFAAEVADGGSYVAFDANPTNLIEGMEFRVTAAPMAGYEYVTAPEGWELADGLVSATFTIGTDDVTVDVPEPTAEPQVVFCRIAGAADPGQLALCSEFAAYLRSVTRTDEEVWIPVDPATGAFDVTDVPAGTWQVEVYGVRVADGKEFLLCEVVEILEDDLAFELPMPDLTLPYVISAAVDVSEAGEFAAVGASGLKELATDIAVDETNDVTVVLKVEEVDVATDTNAQAIAAAFIAAGNTNELEFVELTVLKQVGVAAPEQVGELPQCIEVVIPYPTRGRKNFAVWCNHAGEVAPLRRVRAFKGDEEGFMVGDGKIIVHAKRFSTYAIGSEAGDDLSVLYPNGDGGVFVAPTKAAVYEGVTLDETGAVAGTVTVKLGKPNKKGEMTVSATVKTLADKQTYAFKPETKKVSAFVDGPLALTLVGSNKKSKAHTFTLAIEGDSLTGTFDACTVDGARNVFKVSKDPKRDRLAPFVGYWTLAFGTATSVDATCWVQVSKTGSVHIHGRLADGTLICCHPKAEIGDGWIAAPATVRKLVKGQVKTFAFRVAFDEVTRTVSAVNISPVVVADKKTLSVVSETPVTAVEGGQPKLTKAAVKAMTFGAEGREAPVKSSVKLNATRGELTGTLTWKTPNAKDRMVSETGKVYGIDIDGVLYGSVFFSKTGETRALVVGWEF